MNKLLLLLLMFVTLSSRAQLKQRGTLIRTEKCELLSEGGYKVLLVRPAYDIYAIIANNKFYLRSRESTKVFKLDSEEVSISDGDTVYSYYTSIRKELRIVAIRKCGEYIVVAFFPMNGDQRFMQYIIKPRKNDRQNNK